MPERLLYLHLYGRKRTGKWESNKSPSIREIAEERRTSTAEVLATHLLDL